MPIVTLNQFVDIVLLGIEDLIDTGRTELEDQGHVDTGRGFNSLIKKVVQSSNDKLVVGIQGEDYLLDLDQGVDPSKVDLSAAAEARLLDWAKRKKPTLSESNRKRFVFLTMNKAAFIGYPLPGAYAFTANGRRTGWIEYGINRNADDVFQRKYKVFQLLVDNFEEAFLKLIQEAKQI